MPVSAARWAAFRILKRLETGRGFAADLLRSMLPKEMDLRDRALAEELVMGALRWRGVLDRAIEEASGRQLDKLDLEVKLALRLGAYQLRTLARVPARAAVSEAVEIVKKAGKSSAAGLTNAVLRKISAERFADPPAAESCVPNWMLQRWRVRYGHGTAGRLALATMTVPATYLRLNARFDPVETVRLLADEGVGTEPTELPLCRRLTSGRPAETRCWVQGRVRIQDIGSQRIAPLLRLKPGELFLDLCAAPGGKTFQALEQREQTGPVEGPALAVACDVSATRLAAMRRLATMPVSLVGLDAARPLPFARRFEKILADVPCSGTGTLARNPEIKWRLSASGLSPLATRQRAILSRGLGLLAHGGTLVYSTCSLEPEENEQALAGVTAPFQVVAVHQWLPEEGPGDGFFAAVIART